MAKELIPDVVSVAELSRLLNITPRRIQQLVEEGKLPKALDTDGQPIFGKYPVVACVHAYLSLVRESATSSEAEKELVELKKVNLRIKNEKDSLLLSEIKNEVHPAEAVKQIFGEMVVTIRSRLQALPHQSAPKLQGLESIPEIIAVLEKDVRQVLLDLKDYDKGEFASQSKKVRVIDPGTVEASKVELEQFEEFYGGE
jgi:hypothetical protein